MTFCQWYPILERTVSCNWSFKGTLSPKTFLAYLNVLPQGIFDPFFSNPLKFRFYYDFYFLAELSYEDKHHFAWKLIAKGLAFFNSWLVLQEDSTSG